MQKESKSKYCAHFVVSFFLCAGVLFDLKEGNAWERRD